MCDIGDTLLRIEDVAGNGGRGADTARPSLACSDNGLVVESYVVSMVESRICVPGCDMTCDDVGLESVLVSCDGERGDELESGGTATDIGSCLGDDRLNKF